MNLDSIIQHFKLSEATQVIRLSGGANNRVYKLEFAEPNPLVLKQYFQHPQDQRPRLASEFSFLEYAWKVGIRNIPQPLACSKEFNAALYSFLPGSSAKQSDASEDSIQQMISFFLALNENKSEALHLRLASESCFCIEDYVQITEKRISRLKSAIDENDLGSPLSSFINKELLPKWEQVKCKAALHFDSSYGEKLHPADWCITPSDFGLHNCLIKDHLLSFIDFEYAGWDDPCKTICDLFCQPRIPLPFSHFRFVSEAICSVARDPEKCIQRIEIVFPVMQIKWCCILLNAFTQVGKNRRIFSHSNEAEQGEIQLNQAKELLAKIII